MNNDDLIQDVYKSLLDAYQHAVPGGSGGELVAFEPMGFAPSCVANPGSNIALTAIQEVSDFANQIPEIDGGFYRHDDGSRHLTLQYEAMMSASEGSNADSLAEFSVFKSQARKLYDDASSDGSLDGPKATFAKPADWYDAAHAANWNTYSYDSSTQTAAVPPAVPLAPNVHLYWHVVPDLLLPTLLQPARAERALSLVTDTENVNGPKRISVQLASPTEQVKKIDLAVFEEMQATPAVPAKPATSSVLLTPVFHRPESQSMSRMAMSSSTHDLVSTQATISDTVSVSDHALVSEQAVVPDQALASTISEGRLTENLEVNRYVSLTNVAALIAATVAQPVETSHLKMSFQYCVVHLQRPWLLADFLAQPGWYVPGKLAGSYTAGGEVNNGGLAIVPVAFIAIKDLLMDAVWSAADVNAGKNAVSIGPFSLLGTGSENTSNRGIRITAWICRTQTSLAPDPDPAMTAPVQPPTDAGAGTTATTPTPVPSGL